MTGKRKEKIKQMSELEKVNLFKTMQADILELKEEIYTFRKHVIRSQADAITYFRTISPIDRENVYVLFLDAKTKVIDFINISDGTLTQSLMYPREVVKHAISMAAASIVLMHNHPSGNFEPSEADKKMTKKLLFALKEIDMQLVDHIITGKDTRYFSFYEEGLIDQYNATYRNAVDIYNI
jgi:DNA repair protein RadC